jgi:phage shock protein C
MKGRTFRLDRANKKFMGVCAGLANSAGIDPTIVRIALVIGTVAGGFPWTLIGYGVLAWYGQRSAGQDESLGLRRSSIADISTRMSDIDRRMAEIDRYTATPNSNLAREIEQLR